MILVKIPKYYHFSCYIESKNIGREFLLLFIKSIFLLNGISKNIPLYVSNKPNIFNGEAKISLSSIFDKYSTRIKVSDHTQHNIRRISSLINRIAMELSNKQTTLYFEFKIRYSYDDGSTKRYCWSDIYILSTHYLADDIINLKISHIRGLRRISIEEFFDTFLNTLMNTLQLHGISPKNILIVK
ncbi:MAG: hypothetical protein QW743_07250 [Candidatus Methanomethylicia archaeon]